MTAKIYNNYVGAVMDLEQVIKDLRDLTALDKIEFDFSKYQKEIEEITSKVKELEKKGEENIPYEMYKNSLDLIKKRISSDFETLRNIRLRMYELNKLLENVNEDNISKINYETKNLLYYISNIVTYNDDTNKVLDAAYKTIYNVILNEAIIDDYSILKNSDVTKNDMTREHISVLVNNDIKELLPNEVVEIKLQNASRELGYDCLDRETIKKIAMVKYGSKYDQYLERKKSVSQHFLEKIDNIKKEKEDIETKQDDDRLAIKNLKVYISKGRLKLMALILVPIMGIGGLAYLGTLPFRKHKTTTKTYNVITDEYIGEEKEAYAYTEYVYKANIRKCSPWREKLTCDGYVRDVLEFEYEDKNVTDRIDVNQALRMVAVKNESVEFKTQLDEGDSLTEPETIIVETIVDKDDTISHPAPMVCFPLTGILLAMFIDCAINAFDENWYFKTLKEEFRALGANKKSLRDIIKGKLTRRVIREKYVKIGKDVVKIQEEYADASKKYGEMEHAIPLDLLKTAEKYLSKR